VLDTDFILHLGSWQEIPQHVCLTVPKGTWNFLSRAQQDEAVPKVPCTTGKTVHISFVWCEVNAADSNRSYAAIEEVEEVTLGGITFDTLECGQFFNFDNENVTNSSINDERTLYYDWLANSATTSHITNQRDTFMTYEPIQNTPITGVGGLQAQAEGRGDVNIITSYNGTSYPICLCNVLYIPGNKNNLFSLGH
jgi:hypothetical protein